MITVGVDLGMKKVALSVWDDDVLLETTAYHCNAPEMGAVWYLLGRYAKDWCRQVNPDYVLIEDILIGNNRKYSIGLAKTFGAVASALSGFTVIPVNVKTWKKEVLGNGNADKEKVREYLIQRDSAYSVLCGNDQDRYDAAAIGFYGYIVATRAESLHLADAR